MSGIGIIRHLGSMHENASSRYKSPAFRLKWEGDVLVRKASKFDLSNSNTFWVIAKKNYRGGEIKFPPPHGQKRVNRKTIASLKGTIRVILSDSPCAKVIMPNLQGYSLNLYLIRNVEDTDVFLTIFNERCR